MLVDKIKHKIEQLTHKIEMMEKRKDILIHELYTKRSGRDIEVRLEIEQLRAKLQEDSKFVKFLMELLEDED